MTYRSEKSIMNWFKEFERRTHLFFHRNFHIVPYMMRPWVAHRKKQTCMAWSLDVVKIYVHCLTHIFQITRLIRMKSLVECSQLNYGAPQRRIRSNGVHMWQLCHLQIMWSLVLANSDHPRSWKRLTFFLMNQRPIQSCQRWLFMF